jgi:hypothetical protein
LNSDVDNNLNAEKMSYVNKINKMKMYLQIISKKNSVDEIINIIKSIIPNNEQHPRIDELNIAKILYKQKDIDLKQITTFNGKQPDELNENEKIIFNMKSKKYPIYNVGVSGKFKKCPYNYLKNKPLAGYNKMSVASLYSSHLESCESWGIILGKHDLFEYYLISLDFDVFSKMTGINEPTKQLLDEYMNIGIKDGMYSSSTQANYNVLIDIYHSKKLRQLLSNINIKYKIGINNLEIELDGSNMVIPPTATPCKMTDEMRPRKFLSDVHVYEMHKENDPVENWIISKIYNKIKSSHSKCFDGLI